MQLARKAKSLLEQDAEEFAQSVQGDILEAYQAELEEEKRIVEEIYENVLTYSRSH